MPHRVSTFFRAHSHSFDANPDLKKSSRRLSSSGSSLTSTEDQERNRSGKMPDKKRLPLAGGIHFSPKNSSDKLPQHSSASMSIEIESPPLVFYGNPTASTGALMSGQLKLQINEDQLAIESYTMRMVMEVVRKKPFHSGCRECANHSTDINAWNFLANPMALQRGEHSFPFSFLLPGRLPATMKGSLTSINYVLRASVTTKSGEIATLTHPLDIKRSIHSNDTQRHSVRIFPPTNLTANCQIPPVVYPIGEHTFSMRLDGCVTRNTPAKTQTNWKLKRLTWRFEETQKSISPACAKHKGKGTESDKKSTPHEDVRNLGFGDMKSGWKADYSTADGSIELEFPFGIQNGSRPICDLKADDGIEISHILVVEMIVTEEITPIGKPKQFTPTGAARVLRMHFNLVVTERGGLGISWDEEQPPLYEDVPASPPTYGEMHDLPEYEDLQPLEGISQLSLSGNHDRPGSSGS